MLSILLVLVVLETLYENLKIVFNEYLSYRWHFKHFEN